MAKKKVAAKMPRYWVMDIDEQTVDGPFTTLDQARGCMNAELEHNPDLDYMILTESHKVLIETVGRVTGMVDV